MHSRLSAMERHRNPFDDFDDDQEEERQGRGSPAPIVLGASSFEDVGGRNGAFGESSSRSLLRSLSLLDDMTAPLENDTSKGVSSGELPDAGARVPDAEAHHRQASSSACPWGRGETSLLPS